MKSRLFFFTIFFGIYVNVIAQKNGITLKVEYLERIKNRNDSATLQLKYTKQVEFMQKQVELYVVNDSSFYTYNLYETLKKNFSKILDSNSLDPAIAMQQSIFSMELNKASDIKGFNTIYAKKLGINVFGINDYIYNNTGYRKYFISDTIEKIQWKLLDETKKIDSFICQKAIGKFRGRLWEVWFTNQIPISAGPWKLSDLPGLILEAADTSKLYSFICKSIQMPVKEINKNNLRLNKRIEKISIGAWASIQYNKYKAHNEEIKKIFDSVEKGGPAAYNNPKFDETVSIIKLNIKEPYRPIEIFQQ